MGSCSATTPPVKQPGSPNRAAKAFLRARRDAGLRDFRLHDLRHFMATEMLDVGIALPVVSRRLDHRRRSTTLGRYGHAVPGRDAEAAETLRRIVEQAGWALPPSPSPLRRS
jgi:integrase